MQAIERRIAALEQASPVAVVKTVILRFLSAGDTEAEIYGLRAYDGQSWTRLPGETEQGLIDRATVAVTRNGSGFAFLSMTD